MPTRLANLKPGELSVVPRGANEQIFLVTKEANMADPTPTALEKALKDAGLEGKIEGKVAKALEPVLKEVSDKGKQALQAALKILMSVKDELPPELMKALMAEAGMGNAPAPPAPAPVEQSADTPIMKEDGTWDYSRVAPGNVGIWKEKIASDAKLAKVEKQLADERDVRVTKEFNEKAAGYKNLGVKSEELGQVMKDLSEKAPKTFALFEPILKGLDEKIAKGALFGEVGTTGGGGAGSGAEARPGQTEAEAKIEMIAKGMVEKSTDGKLTREQAITKAWQQNPALYSNHRSEVEARKRRA